MAGRLKLSAQIEKLAERIERLEEIHPVQAVAQADDQSAKIELLEQRLKEAVERYDRLKRLLSNEVTAKREAINAYDKLKRQWELQAGKNTRQRAANARLERQVQNMQASIDRIAADRDRWQKESKEATEDCVRARRGQHSRIKEVEELKRLLREILEEYVCKTEDGCDVWPNDCLVHEAVEACDMFKEQEKERADKRELCRGCWDEHYHEDTKGGCWSFGSAKVVEKMVVRSNQEPPYYWSPQETLSCHHMKGFVWLQKDDPRVREKAPNSEGGDGYSMPDPPTGILRASDLEFCRAVEGKPHCGLCDAALEKVEEEPAVEVNCPLCDEGGIDTGCSACCNTEPVTTFRVVQSDGPRGPHGEWEEECDKCDSPTGPAPSDEGEPF